MGLKGPGSKIKVFVHTGSCRASTRRHTSSGIGDVGRTSRTRCKRFVPWPLVIGAQTQAYFTSVASLRVCLHHCRGLCLSLLLLVRLCCAYVHVARIGHGWHKYVVHQMRFSLWLLWSAKRFWLLRPPLMLILRSIHALR